MLLLQVAEANGFVVVLANLVDVLVDGLEIHRVLLLRDCSLLLRRLAVLLSAVALVEV